MFIKGLSFLNTAKLLVLSIHFIFLFTLFIQPTFHPKRKVHKSLIVKTVVPKPASRAVAVEKKPALPARQTKTAVQQAQTAQQKPVVSTAASPKKVQTKPTTPTAKQPAIVDKKIAPAKQTPAKNRAQQNRAKISDALLHELEESIAKIENKSDKPLLSQKGLAAAPIVLQIDSETSGEKDDYISQLTLYLQQALTLPAYGEVKVQLTLQQDGSVVKVVVLKAQNEKNRVYLEKNLKTLKFSPLTQAEQTFTLTFYNK